MVQSTVDSEQDSVSSDHLQRQSKENLYRQKLQAYQEGQQRQAQLVQKLQTKVTGNWFTPQKSLNWKFLRFNHTTNVCLMPGSSVQEEVWRSRRTGAGEDLRVWEAEIAGK